MKKTFTPILFVLITLPAVSQHNTAPRKPSGQPVDKTKSFIRPDSKPLPFASIDGIVKTLMDTAEVTGLCLGIVQNDQPAYVKAYGYKNKALDQLNDTATCFYGASLSKSLFACLVMQLVDRKLIDLDKPVCQYLPKPLPEYDNYRDLKDDPRWKLITARHCLDHTTGFPNWRMFNSVHENKLEIFFTPGQRYAYSGEGLALLQLVVETITSRPLDELAAEYIFRPFGMRRTSYIWQPAFESDFAVGHMVNEDTSAKSKPGQANAAGSLETTIADYTRFMAAVLRGEGLSAKAKKEMLSTQIAILSPRQTSAPDSGETETYKKIQLGYGLGWGIFTTPYGRAFFKEGHYYGWMHYAIGFPDQHKAVVIMTNSSNGESIFKELFEKLTGITIPWEWEGYFPYQPTVRLSAEQLQEYTGDYTGRYNVSIKLTDGRLKIECASVKLLPTNLYAAAKDHFFMKTMDLDINFVRDQQNKIIKASVNDEGEAYDLIPSPPSNQPAAK